MAKKNILLLYITEVSGHHSASLAIEKALNLVSDKVNILNLNAFRYTTPISEKITNRIYTTVIRRTPKIWDMVYDNQKVKKNIERLKGAIDKLNSPKLKKLFGEFKPDIVVCTQAYPCGMVSAYKKRFNADIPLVGVLTDYVPHAYWVYDNVDYYICPNENVGRRLTQQGVAPQRIRTLGIPHDPSFSDPVQTAQVLERMNLEKDKPTILIMGGGQGLGPIKTITRSFEKLPFGIQEIIVTGTNKKLFRSLKKSAKKSKHRVILLGYVHNVNELMSVADLVVTKPGGITTSEALAKQLPMLIIKPIPGQEANNTTFLTGEQAAVKVDRPASIHRIVEDLFTDSGKLESLRQSCARIAKPQAAVDIARFILEIAA
ncbi:MAG: glycosyltransferase [Candidatus Omnitrophica bacterium]|nr:glycosyltransferase [Candidatus Omnitrophota bacterium]